MIKRNTEAMLEALNKAHDLLHELRSLGCFEHVPPTLQYKIKTVGDAVAAATWETPNNVPVGQEFEAHVIEFNPSGWRPDQQEWWEENQRNGNVRGCWEEFQGGLAFRPFGAPMVFYEDEILTVEEKVLFRMWEKDVIAIFPEIVGNDPVTCQSYMHVGQHGACDPNHVIRRSRPATPAEYADLKAELESRGYVLQVIQRQPKDAYTNRWNQLKEMDDAARAKAQDPAHSPRIASPAS